jgi:CMP-N,N'-diacetyllegionaminic acid synthase
LTRYCIDIDGVLCQTVGINYMDAVPDERVINIVNDLFDKGHNITIYTARGVGRGIDMTSLTKKQLAEWGVKYHKLYANKPPADIYIDDKALNIKEFMEIV